MQRVLFGLAVVALAWAILVPTAALAQNEPQIRTSVTDEAGVLSANDEARVADALSQLLKTHNVQLFVAFVDTTRPATVTDFTRATFDSNSLGGNDALLLVAINDRSDALWVGPSLDSITSDEINEILDTAVAPRLADGDFAGAMIDGAAAIGEASAGSIVETAAPATLPPATAAPGSEGTGEPGPSTTTALIPVLAVLLIVGGVFLVGRTVLVRRSAAKADAAERDRLSREANQALLATDEAVRDADQEVGFAEAQWGEAEAAPYQDALAKAREELRAAFAVRQRLDDAQPDTPEQRRQMLQEILSRTASAGQLLKAQAARLAMLRDMERTAPDQLAALPPVIDTLRGRRATAATTLDRLTATYAPSAVASVSGNLVEAAKALDSAESETTRGRALPDASRGEMVVALRHAQASVASATRLIESVERLATSLDDAAARLPKELAAAAADVETARAGLARLASAPQLPQPAQAPGSAPAQDPAAALAAAQQALDQARRASEATPLDPLAALERATWANQAADAIVAGLQATEAQRQRRLQVAAAAVTTARDKVDRTVDYITTRRHGVGREARTRAAEAEASLTEAQQLAASNPEGAVAAAQRAGQLADEAYRLAASEFEAWDAGNGPVAGPYTRGGGASPGAEIVGAVLGGIIGGMLSGGGRGSGWGGTPWGGSGGGHGGGFGLPSGPFGGGGRGGGGGFGGGGHGGGGRW